MGHRDTESRQGTLAFALFRVRMSYTWTRQPTTQVAKSWSDLEEPVVVFEVGPHGHPLNATGRSSRLRMSTFVGDYVVGGHSFGPDESCVDGHTGYICGCVSDFQMEVVSRERFVDPLMMGLLYAELIIVSTRLTAACVM